MRSTTTKQPTNRAPNEAARPGPKWPKMPLSGQIWSFLGLFFIIIPNNCIHLISWGVLRDFTRNPQNFSLSIELHNIATESRSSPRDLQIPQWIFRMDNDILSRQTVMIQCIPFLFSYSIILTQHFLLRKWSVVALRIMHKLIWRQSWEHVYLSTRLHHALWSTHKQNLSLWEPI